MIYLCPLIDPRSYSRITQQPHCRKDEYVHYCLVLGRITLYWVSELHAPHGYCCLPTKASCENVLLLLSFAECIAQAELAVAVTACLLRCAVFERTGCWLLRGDGRVEGDDGAIAKACAFAEGRGC